MTHSFKDILGNDLAVGDELAVAFPSGNTAELRVGTILSITEKPTEIWNPNLRAYFPGNSTYSMEIKWDKAKSAYGVPDKPTKMNRTHGRILKLS
jgi:hypothetical protein